MFKDDRRWFKISVKVEELAIDKTRAIQDISYSRYNRIGHKYSYSHFL